VVHASGAAPIEVQEKVGSSDAGDANAGE